MQRNVVFAVSALGTALLVVGLWLGLGNRPGDAGLPAPVDEPEGSPLPLALNVPFAELQVPEDSRGGHVPPDKVALAGPWYDAGQNGRGMYRYQVPAPFRPRGMFFLHAQPGMRVTTADGTELAYQKGGRSAQPAWWHDSDTITVLMPTRTPPPALDFAYERATRRERGLNWSTAHADDPMLSPEEFVRGTTVTEGWESRRGLLLPAPARASFDVHLPEAAVLTMAPGLVRPELSELGQSDGCSLTVQVTAGGSTETVYEQALELGVFTPVRVDLSKWSDSDVRVTLSTAPGATTLYDYCFVGEPVIAPRKANPRKVVVVFVDTLRPDHLSLHGYARETTPNLDAFASDAVVFENARSIAPWTLPSARTIVTGREPEYYDVSETLQSRLAEAGFANGMIAGNVYLSANFGMNRDWDYHEVGMFPPADQVTDSALEWLDQHDGQDSLLLVHYMSAHLPYLEPTSYRSMWAGLGPPGLRGEFHLQAVRRARLGQDPDGQQYVRDRYDQCIRWIDDELQRLYSRIDDNDVLVFLSDHGEEFWDHSGYEHGHSLFEELLRVPLVIKAPGLRGARIDAPVSLLDVTPTVLDLLGLPPIEDADGRSLAGLARGDGTEDAWFRARKLAVGRPLYGSERWGVIDGQQKWTTTEGMEELYDLAADPGETTDLTRGNPDAAAPWRDKIGEALGRESGVGYRFVPTRGLTARDPLKLTVKVPGGIRAAWKGEDPLQRSSVVQRDLDPETVEFTWLGGHGGTREAYVLPVAPVAETTHALEAIVEQNGWKCRMTVGRGVQETPGRVRPPLAQARTSRGTVTMTWSMAPAFPKDGLHLDAMDDEMKSALEAIGYTDRDADGDGGQPGGDGVEEPSVAGSSTIPPCEG